MVKKYPALLLVAVGLLLFVCGATYFRTTAAPAAQPGKAGGDKAAMRQAEPPVDGWYVCADLGIGPVPGLPDPRQRLSLCHSGGWQVSAYCEQPDRPAPPLGEVCTRVNADTYDCGAGFQRLVEYLILATPSPTPTASTTPTTTPTVTASPTPTTTPTATRGPSVTPTVSATPVTATVTPRGPTGGRGFLSYGEFLRFKQAQNQVHTQVRAAAPPPPIPTVPIEQAPHLIFLPNVASTGFNPAASPLNEIDFQDPTRLIRIRITPPDRRVNHGKPIWISFYPAQRCDFGDHRGCVVTYPNASGAQNVLISVHSGVGGEGQALRNAVEGTSYTGAGLSLRQVLANLNHLSGATVTIQQGDLKVTGLRLEALARVPSKSVGEYFDSPASAALGMAAGFNPGLAAYTTAGQPLLLFETCGWQVAGEPLGRGASAASASVYLGVIR